MISKSLLAAMQKQINHELGNAQIYRGMAVYFEHRNFHGFGGWMKKQTSDELGHAQRFIDHLLDRGARPELGPLPASKTDFKGVLDAFKAALATEEKTTAMIHELYALATKEQDYPALSMLKWFVDEQVEEEKWANEIVSLIEDVGEDHKGGIYMLDHRWPKQAGDKSGS